MHKELQKVGLIVLKNGASSHFAKRAGKDPRFQRHNYHHLNTKVKKLKQPNRE